jgi:acyl-CoA reductase-like NAD-dependent aldehyde dehydrogenase
MAASSADASNKQKEHPQMQFRFLHRSRALLAGLALFGGVTGLALAGTGSSASAESFNNLIAISSGLRLDVRGAVNAAFIPRYVERVNALPVGDPADPTTIVGPLINRRGAQRVSNLVKDAATKGARLLTGDGTIEGPNRTLIKPVVLTDVTPEMDIYASEIFGPAVVIHPVGSTDAAIDLANDTEYGLTGGVISRDLNAALDVV